MIILIDMDGVLADFESSFNRIWRERYPDRLFIPSHQRRNFYVTRDYPNEYRPDIWAICSEPGFIAGLPPIEGAVEAINQISASGVTIKFCSSPLLDYRNNVVEKYMWVEKHFGKNRVADLIVTRDKTLVRGNILIDDNPEIKGLRSPEWEHVLLDQPYNREVVNKRRIATNWSNWREVIGV